MAEPSQPTKPLCFGVIADVQYADRGHGSNFAQTVTRYYRPALGMLQRTTERWAGAPSDQRPEFVLNLADLIDGVSYADSASDVALERCMSHFAPLDEIGIACHHHIGNHELTCFSPGDLLAKGFGSSGRLFYSFQPRPGWRFIVLNSMEHSIVRPGCTAFKGPLEDDAGYMAARAMIMEKNPNLRGGEATWYSGANWFDGLPAGISRRFVPYNGALGSEQLAWLEAELESAAGAGQRAIVSLHIPVHPGSADPADISWDYEEALAVLLRVQRPGGGPVARAVFAGHFHDGGFCEEDGIAHVTFMAPFETDPSKHEECSADVFVFDDRIQIQGRGRQPSYDLTL